MSASFFFYDLETSGLKPDRARIMQFAGQRTDADLNPIGEPINRLISLNKDVLPDPRAVIVHGITPQQTLLEGVSETDFLKEFYAEVALPQTTFVGFNNIRFDDEFMRYLNYRNLYDPYAWSYEHDSSRWDILDVVRMTRALRPDGINWPTNPDGSKSNRLEHLTKANNLSHEAAHDALSDVLATIAVAGLIKQKQPRLYDFMYELRQKKAAAALANSGQPFVYTSSHYPSSQYHTTVVAKVADHPDPNCIIVYDLRYDPTPWLNQTAEQLAEAWRYVADRPADNPPLPVKTVRLNRCPAVAPLGVASDNATMSRLALSLDEVKRNYSILTSYQDTFATRLREAVQLFNQEQQSVNLDSSKPIDARLYDGFYSDSDRQHIKQLHVEETPEKVRQYASKYQDKRLRLLSPLYLARNFEPQLNQSERKTWDEHVNKRLFGGGPSSQLAIYFQTLSQVAIERSNDAKSQSLLEDLKLYGESLVPSDMIN